MRVKSVLLLSLAISFLLPSMICAQDRFGKERIVYRPQLKDPGALRFMKIDDDDQADLLVWGQELNWFRNEGEGQFDKRNLIFNRETQGVKAGDLDGDGDRDLVLRSSDRFYWIQKKGEKFDDAQSIKGEINFLSRFGIVDINADGRADLWAVERGGNMLWFENDAEGFSSHRVVKNFDDYIADAILMNVDSDSLPDLVVASRDTLYWRKDTTGGYGAKSAIISDYQGWPPPQIYKSDTDRNGYPDLLVLVHAPSYQIRRIMNTKDGFTESTVVKDNVTISEFELSDVDGDSYADLLAASSMRNKFAWYKNVEGDHFGEEHVVNEDTMQARAPMASDIEAANLDSDQDKDLVGANLNGKEITWYANDGINTDIEQHSGREEIPNEIQLRQNYPNPFNPTTQITFSLPQATHVQLTVYDMLGRRVATLLQERKQAGRHTISFDAGNLSSGVYVYRLEAGSFTTSRKMLLVR